MSYRVLVTARSFGKTPGPHHDFLAQHDCLVEVKAQAHPLTAAALGDLIGGYDAAILGLDYCDATVIARADRLRVISRYGSGVDQVDLAAAHARGIVVTNTPGANRFAVAELAIGLLFTLSRDIVGVAAAARNGTWKRSAGVELTGKTIGVIGLGLIGREVAARAHGLGMVVLGYDPYVADPPALIRQVDLPELLRESDFVSLHSAATPATENLIDAARLALMKPGAHLINTARGALVDERALLDALRSGHLAGAAADALRDDPPTESPLLALENFYYTPHIGGTTRESVERMALMAAQNTVAILRGEPCRYIVRPPADAS
jgi:D-3-phosphoglycerate dehydrogenase